MILKISGKIPFGTLWVNISGEKMVLKTKKIRLYSITLSFFIILISSCAISTAEGYYADIQISVYETGIVDIKGVTNYPDLSVKDSNMQTYWLLNITTEDIFEDYVYTLTLPDDSVINRIKASGFIGVKEEDGRLIISGAGENESLSILVQYQINKTSDIYSFFDYVILSVLLLSIVILTFLLVYFVYKDKQKKSIKYNLDDNNDMMYSFKGLNERQKEIVKLLIDAKRPLTQTDIQKELDMPKAAVSRNVHSLELKGLLEIEQTGMSNLIRLKKQ